MNNERDTGPAPVSAPWENDEDSPIKRRISRRAFLRAGSVGSAAAALVACSAPSQPPGVTPVAAPTAPPAAPAIPPTATTAAAAPIAAQTTMVSDLLPYPRIQIATLDNLRAGAFNAIYPDDESPVQIIKLGSKILGGVGPEGDIVAYSSLCTHMGCPLQYDAQTQTLLCSCHFSHFDVARDSMLITGPATENLPRITLEVEGSNIYAVGVQGLIYGRPHNLSLTKLGD